MNKGTQTVPNHRDGARDVIWGIEVKRVVAWVFSFLVAILGWSIVDRIRVERVLADLSHQEWTPAQKQYVVDTVTIAILEAMQNEDVVRRREWLDHNNDIAAKLEEYQHEMKGEMRAMRNEFKEDIRYNRKLWSNIDLTGKDDR